MQRKIKSYLAFCKAAIFALLVLSPANAAEIFVQETGTPSYLIIIRGEITKGDAARFSEIAALVNVGFVLLESRGGLILEGLQIGERIRENGYSTGVAPESTCASACALVWLGGISRYMAPTALIGFHAAYIEDEKGKQESGLANALIGMYLNRLGFDVDTVVFATSAGPDEVNWLNAAQAQSAGIPLHLLESNGKETFIEAPFQSAKLDKSRKLKLPKGYRWIVLQSAVSPLELSKTHAAAVTVKTESGFYASILGPFTQENAYEELRRDSSIPKDAYLSSGNGFLFQIQ